MSRMNALYNLIYGRKNSFYKNSDVADEADHVDENGFVLVNSEELQERCTENENSPIQQYKTVKSFDTEKLCQTGDTSSCQSSQSPLPSSSVADIPMQTSALLRTIESFQRFSLNKREYLDLDLLNYSFNTELSILNDTGVRQLETHPN